MVVDRILYASCLVLSIGCGSSSPSPAGSAPAPVAAVTAGAPRYTAAGALQLPADYREWVFLGSGLGMTYGPLGARLRNGAPPFDNVFVTPASYRAFLGSGKWPDKTVFVLEIRGSESHAALNKDGHFQRDVLGLEAHVKDASVRKGHGPWTFYVFDDVGGDAPTSAEPVARDANCYTCHEDNAAVDTTFVQFYPALYDVALAANTLEPGFEKLPLTAGGLLQHIRADGWAGGKAALEQVQTTHPEASVLAEGTLNLLGYRLIAANQFDGAIGVLEWVASRDPASANAQDSLADAYLAAGKKAEARTATERCLAILASDKNIGEDLRKRIEDGARDRLAKLPK